MWVSSTVSVAAGRLVSYQGRWKSWKEWSYALWIFAQNQNFSNLQYLGVFTNVLRPQHGNLEDCTLFATFTILCLLKNWLGLTALNQHKLFSISEVNIFRRGLLAFSNLLVEPDQYLVATDLCMQCSTPISAPGVVGWCDQRQSCKLSFLMHWEKQNLSLLWFCILSNLYTQRWVSFYSSTDPCKSTFLLSKTVGGLDRLSWCS